MFESDNLPSSFQTPTSSLTQSDKINPFNNINTEKSPLLSYINTSSQNYINTDNGIISQTLFSKPEEITYRKLPPLQPIKFQPNLWTPITTSSYGTPLTQIGNTEQFSSDKLQKLRKDNFDLYFENRRIKDQMMKLRSDTEVIVSQNQRLQKELDTYKKDIDRSKILQSMNTNLKTQINMVLDQLRNQRNKIEALQRQIQGYKIQLQNQHITRDKQKIAYKNLLNQMHAIKNQLDNIRKGPAEIFKNNTNITKMKLLEQQKLKRQKYLQQLKQQIIVIKKQQQSNKQPSEGQYIIMNLQKQIKQIKESNKGKRQSMTSKRVIEDNIIRNYKQSHEQEINRLKREIQKKARQAIELENELSKLQ